MAVGRPTTPPGAPLDTSAPLSDYDRKDIAEHLARRFDGNGPSLKADARRQLRRAFDRH